MTNDSSKAGFNRRRFLAGTGAVGAAGALQALMGNTAAAAGPGRGNNRGIQAADNGGYGPLQPASPNGELLLPAGFSYVAFGQTGTPMSDGNPTPARHDGMAAFAGEDGTIRLVRNHEQSQGTAFASPSYDPAAAGGTTTLVFDPEEMRLLETSPSLSGTIRNCAGGPTPHGSWLSCEETFTGLDVETPHGYVFEVPVDADGPVEPVPYKAMGRFTHEAVAVDPATGHRLRDRGPRQRGLLPVRSRRPGRPGCGRAAADAGHRRPAPLRHPSRAAARPAVAGRVGRHRRPGPGQR